MKSWNFTVHCGNLLGLETVSRFLWIAWQVRYINYGHCDVYLREEINRKAGVVLFHPSSFQNNALTTPVMYRLAPGQRHVIPHYSMTFTSASIEPADLNSSSAPGGWGKGWCGSWSRVWEEHRKCGPDHHSIPVAINLKTASLVSQCTESYPAWTRDNFVSTDITI